MKTQWERLVSYVRQNDKEAVLKWLYDYDSDVRRQFDYMPDRDYLDSESDEPWLHEVIQEIELAQSIPVFDEEGEYYWCEDMNQYLYTIFPEKDDD